MAKTALVVGVSGITGSNLAEGLIEENWTVYGLARNPTTDLEGIRSISADLLSMESLEAALSDVKASHVFFTSWTPTGSEAENIRVNSLMVRNLLNTVARSKTVQHVALVTGLKHYLGPFESYAKEGTLPQTPVREEHPRLDIQNFYYAQEDEVYSAAERDGFTWSIHRPHTVIGKAVGNKMNMGTTLAVYASICKESGRPFQFPGSQAQWEGLSDVTDARVLAKHMLWAATTDQAHNEAFNVVNGDIFRWKWLWPQLAAWFGVESGGFDGTIHPLAPILENDAALWRSIAAKNNLKESNIDRLASAWHTDLDLGRPIEVMTDMSKSRKLGFAVYQDTRDSFFDLFSQLREDRLIP